MGGVDGVGLKWRAIAATALCLAVSSASAQEWWDATRDGIPIPSIASSLPYAGDPSGIRKRLAGLGIIYGLEYTNDVLSNVRGGIRTGTIDQGRLQGILTVDFEKLSGWSGLTGFANFFQIHNTGRMRRDYVGGINTISAIEAVPTTRLWELWLEQKFANNVASLKVGQLAADNEFFATELGAMFLQNDWPTIVAANLPSGGPAYPLSTPGARLKVTPLPGITFLAAVFNGDPAGPGLPGEEQSRNRYGVNFRLTDPPLVIGEVQLQRNVGPKDTGLATTIKVGGWRHFGWFDDMRFANDGLLLADPASSGVAARHRGNFGLYAVVEQQIYRPAGGEWDSGVSVFNRMSVSPSDRNLIDAYIDGGIVFAGLIPGRPNDRFGASVTHARFSDGIRAYERDIQIYTGEFGSIRDYETSIELSYVAHIVPGWIVQPSLQLVRHPDGNPGRNATVVGVRSQWRY